MWSSMSDHNFLNFQRFFPASPLDGLLDHLLALGSTIYAIVSTLGRCCCRFWVAYIVVPIVRGLLQHTMVWHNIQLGDWAINLLLFVLRVLIDRIENFSLSAYMQGTQCFIHTTHKILCTTASFLPCQFMELDEIVFLWEKEAFPPLYEHIWP